jgi:hypothetical protein
VIGLARDLVEVLSTDLQDSSIGSQRSEDES